MWSNLLICALALGTPTAEAEQGSTPTYSCELRKADTTEVVTPAINEKFWARKKALHLGYEIHHFQNEAGGEFPAKFGIGYATVRNVWLHKKPIARMMRFAIDHGANLNYTLFDTKSVGEDGYTGPSGYLGSGTAESEGEMPFDLKKLGNHYLSVGYAVGVSLTINPVAQLRVNGYCHFVPSFAIQFSGSQIYTGFMPYLKYGCEVGYGKIGVGVEWGTGMSKMTDLMSKFASEQENFEVPKSKYFSNYTKIYLSIRMGKVKKK